MDVKKSTPHLRIYAMLVACRARKWRVHLAWAPSIRILNARLLELCVCCYVVRTHARRA